MHNVDKTPQPCVAVPPRQITEFILYRRSIQRCYYNHCRLRGLTTLTPLLHPCNVYTEGPVCVKEAFVAAGCVCLNMARGCLNQTHTDTGPAKHSGQDKATLRLLALEHKQCETIRKCVISLTALFMLMLLPLSIYSVTYTAAPSVIEVESNFAAWLWLLQTATDNGGVHQRCNLRHCFSLIA